MHKVPWIGTVTLYFGDYRNGRRSGYTTTLFESDRVFSEADAVALALSRAYINGFDKKSLTEQVVTSGRKVKPQRKCFG